MKCIRCNKPLKAYARQVSTDDGIAGWGPKCARLAFGLKRRQPAQRAGMQRRATAADALQIDWIAQVAA